VPGFCISGLRPLAPGQEAIVPKQIDTRDVLTERTFRKLHVFARLLARQAAREQLGTPITPPANGPFGSSSSPGMPVVLGTATCT
jgi:hypothetical protein